MHIDLLDPTPVEPKSSHPAGSPAAADICNNSLQYVEAAAAGRPQTVELCVACGQESRPHATRWTACQRVARCSVTSADDRLCCRAAFVERGLALALSVRRDSGD